MRTITLPKTATITCAYCGKRSRRTVPRDASPQYFDCDKCKQRMAVSLANCCIICGFTNKRCIPSLVREAEVKGLNIR